MLKDYFDCYLPIEPTPELASFVDVSVFRYFDDAMKASQGLRGREKKEFLNKSGECLAHVMVHCFDATASGVGLEATVHVRDANLSIGAWTRKCFANPVTDSIQAKCTVFFGADTGSKAVSRSDILRNSRKLAELCSALGCSAYFGKLHQRIIRTIEIYQADISENLALAGAGRYNAIVALWTDREVEPPEASLATCFAIMKLHDLGWSGEVVHGLCTPIPLGVFERFEVEASDVKTTKGWHFSSFIAGLDYLQGSPVSPNGGVFERIWKLYKCFEKPANDAEHIRAIELMLGLVSGKGYHHDIKDLKRILKLVPAGHTEVVSRSFKPAVPMACCLCIVELFRGYSEVHFSTKMELLALLDTARGTEPKDTWKRKLVKLQGASSWHEVLRFLEWVSESKSLASASRPNGWTDDVFRRFQKATAWAIGDQ